MVSADLFAAVCDRAKTPGAEVLPAEKDIQLAAVQDCNTQMLQVCYQLLSAC